MGLEIHRVEICNCKKRQLIKGKKGCFKNNFKKIFIISGNICVKMYLLPMETHILR